MYKLISQTPHSSVEGFKHTVRELAYLSEKYGYNEILVTHSTSGIDPWVIVFNILQGTKNITPLVATQPDYISTTTLLRMVRGIRDFHGRSVNINIINGTSKRLSETSTNASADYSTLESYINEIQERQITPEKAVYDFGLFEKNNDVRQETDVDCRPRFYLSGSGESALNSARRTNSGFLTVPEPVEYFKETLRIHNALDEGVEIGICLGIIARPSDSEAWADARRIFTYTRQDQISLRLKKQSKMNAVNRLANLAVHHEVYDDVYWFGAFISGRNIYPYLVGSYETVAEYLYRYYMLGVRTLVLNVPFTAEEFEHRAKVFSILNNKDEG